MTGSQKLKDEDRKFTATSNTAEGKTSTEREEIIRVEKIFLPRLEKALNLDIRSSQQVAWNINEKSAIPRYIPAKCSWCLRSCSAQGEKWRHLLIPVRLERWMGREGAMPTIWAELKWREMKAPLPILEVYNVHDWSRLMLNWKGTVVGTTCMKKAWSGVRRVTRGPWQQLSITMWNTVFTRSRETLNMLPLGKQFSELILRDSVSANYHLFLGRLNVCCPRLSHRPAGPRKMEEAHLHPNADRDLGRSSSMGCTVHPALFHLTQKPEPTRVYYAQALLTSWTTYTMLWEMWSCELVGPPKCPGEMGYTVKIHLSGPLRFV